MMHEKEGVLRLNPISSGTVLDHLPIKSALKIIDLLNLDFEMPVMVAVNIDSKKMGKKDLIFIEGKELNEKEVQKIGLIANGSTWNIIHDKKVISKKKIDMPKEFIDMLHCNNPKCITNFEQVTTKFTLEKNEVRCNYCEKEMSLKEAIKYIK